MGRRVKEIWVPLIDKKVKSIYEISNWGNIRNINSGKRVKPFVDKDGYLRYTLQGTNGKKVKKYAHTVVASHFVLNEDPEIFTQVNHKDFRKDNNYYKNLEWISQHDNILHAVSHRRQIPLACAAHGYATMTNEYVHGICKMLENGMSIKEIVYVLGFDNKNKNEYERIYGKIRHIKKRKAWTVISYEYDF